MEEKLKNDGLYGLKHTNAAKEAPSNAMSTNFIIKTNFRRHLCGNSSSKKRLALGSIFNALSYHLLIYMIGERSPADQGQMTGR